MRTKHKENKKKGSAERRIMKDERRRRNSLFLIHNAAFMVLLFALPLQAQTAEQIANRVFDSSHGALKASVVASGGAGASTTSYNLDQIFSKVFDATHGALKLNVVAGTVSAVALQGVAVSSSAPTDQSCLVYVLANDDWESQPCFPSAGTVRSFSAGNLPPLFTTTVSNPTTTPALAFTLSNAPAHTWFGNSRGSTGAPGFNSIGLADLPAALSQKPNAASPICYASYYGSDSNDGLSWGTSKATVGACYDALPGAYEGSGYGAGGFIYVADGGSTSTTCGNPVPMDATSTRGLWILGPNDPNWASPPTGWRKQKIVTIIGSAGISDAVGQAGVGAQACLAGGSSTDRTKPALWIAGTNIDFRFEGLAISRANDGTGHNPALPVEIALGSDGTSSDNTATMTFSYCTFRTNAGAGYGPSFAVPGYAFEIWLEHVHADGNPTGSNTFQQAAIGIDGTQTAGGNPAGLIYAHYLSMNGGGLYYNEDGGNASIDVDDVICEALASGYCVNLNGWRVNAWATPKNVVAADSSGTALRVSPSYSGVGQNVATQVSSIGNQNVGLTGPALLLGGDPSNQWANKITPPIGQRQAGFYSGAPGSTIAARILGQHDAARRIFAPSITRFQNLITQAGGTWKAATNGTGITLGVAAPDGTSNAFNIPVSIAAVTLLTATQTITVGDYVIVGCWMRNSNAATTSAGNVIAIGWQSVTGTLDVNSGGLNLSLNPALPGDGEWEWVEAVAKVVTTSGNSSKLTYTFTTDSSHAFDVYAPTLLYIPAGTVSQSEAFEIANQLNPIRGTAVPGQIATLPGETYYTDSIKSFGSTVSQVSIPTGLTLADVSGSGSLSANTQYFVEVTATNTSGETPVSAESNITTANDGLSHSLTVKWSPASGASGYKVYCSTTTGTETLGSTITIWSGNYTTITSCGGGASPPTRNSTGDILATSTSQYQGGAASLTGTLTQCNGTTQWATGITATGAANCVNIPSGGSNVTVQGGSPLATANFANDFQVDGSGNVSLALNWGVVHIDEEFLGDSTTSVQIGAYGWNLANVGTSGCSPAVGTTGSEPTIGFFKLVSAATSGKGCTLVLNHNSATGNVGNMDKSWVAGWRIQPTHTANLELRVGFVTPGVSTAIPSDGFYLRFDDQLKNMASAVCNDAGNKCGCTTLTGSTSQTVTFDIKGGTATGSVALTGTNAIANGTAITVVSAGAGYNSTAGGTVGTVTGGTATCTGSVALTPTLGAAASGPDTHWMIVSTTGSVETAYDTAQSPSVAYYRFDFTNVTQTKIGVTIEDASGSSLVAQKTICSSLCDVLVAPTTASLSPGVIAITGTTTGEGAYLDAFKMNIGSPASPLAR
jgi:hypothetical protein